MTTAGEVPDQMRRDIAAGQSDKAGKTAHAVKGRVGTLGMTHLHSIVTELERALHDGTAADELISIVAQSIGQMRGELASVLGTGVAKEKAHALADTACDTKALERVVWSEAYSVGVAEMDNQHKKLIAMINQLADESAAAFHVVLSGMFDYTQAHFKAEEAYLKRIGFPHIAAHEVEHEEFVERMATFSIAASEGISDRVGTRQYLKEWLLSHILSSDMKYRHFIEATTLQEGNAAGQRKCILLIDDDPAVLQVLDECLNSSYQTRVAVSGLDGLEQACLQPQPDLKVQ